MVIVTDSLGRNMDCLSATTRAYPGATLESMLGVPPEIGLEKFKYIILLVGTNDLTAKFVYLWYKNTVRFNRKVKRLPFHSKTPVHRIVNDYRVLIKAIRAINHKIKIMVSAILPRRFDYFENRGYLKNVNKGLKAMTRKIRKCKFLPSFKPMIRNRKPRENFYCRDGLHVTQQGLVALKRFFMSQANDLIRAGF